MREEGYLAGSCRALHGTHSMEILSLPRSKRSVFPHERSVSEVSKERCQSISSVHDRLNGSFHRQAQTSILW